MKTFIFLSIFLMPFTWAQAKTLVPAKTIQFQDIQGTLDLANAQARLTWSCSYRSGIIFPESKSCGGYTTTIGLSPDGKLKLPELKTFSGFRARSANNYSLLVMVYSGERHIVTFNIEGKDEIKAFSKENRPVILQDILASELEVDIEGVPLVNTAYITNSKASLNAHVRQEHNPRRPYILSGSFNMISKTYENVERGYTQDFLKDFKRFSFSSYVLAYTETPGELVLHVTLSLPDETTESEYDKVYYGVSVPLQSSADMLSKIQRVNLQKKEQ